MEEDTQEEGTVASWEWFLNKMWDCGENPEGVLGFILGFISGKMGTKKQPVVIVRVPALDCVKVKYTVKYWICSII